MVYTFSPCKCPSNILIWLLFFSVTLFLCIWYFNSLSVSFFFVGFTIHITDMCFFGLCWLLVGDVDT